LDNLPVLLGFNGILWDLVGFHGIQCEKNEVLADITPRTVVYLKSSRAYKPTTTTDSPI
jgi:hypothetical protein